MEFQMQICSILRFSWSILKKCCAHLRMSSSKTQMLFLERLYSKNVDCFVRDSSRLHLTFAAFCLSFVINSYCVDQLALLTGFRTDLRHQYGVADVPPSETSLSGDERGESSAVPRLKRIEICMETPCWFPPG